MARWELKEAPEMIPVANEHYDKILEEIADILYRHICKSQGQWLDPIQQNSTVGGNNRTEALIKDSVPKPQRRSAC